MTEVLRLKKSNCKNCYKCIRHCPVKSIRISGNQAHIVGNECILCGQCFVVCPQNAKQIVNEVEKVKVMIQSGAPVYVSLAPSFAANYEGIGINGMRKALVQLGFTAVEETAVGADIVKKEYERILDDYQPDVLISSCCHSLNLLIQKHFPMELPYLAKVLSPMQAHCKDIKTRVENAKTVFIGPCVAKKDEVSYYGDTVDACLTFEELSQWLSEEDIKLVPDMDNDENTKSRIFPTTGGVIASMKKRDDYSYIAIDGTENCIAALKDIERGDLHKCFIEMSACAGSCISGPVMEKFHRSPVRDYASIKRYAGKKDFDTATYSHAELTKNIDFIDRKLKMPTETEIASTLHKMGKNKAADELNCGSCGYNTCREKAIAILQGKADVTMCLPFLKDKAENFSDNIINNTPNGILVLNEDLEVQQINKAALHLVNISHPSDVLGEQVIRILDPVDFMEVRKTGRAIRNKRIYLAEYNKYIEETIILDREYHILICIMRDVTDEENVRKKKESLGKQTIEITDNVVNKQMRIVQEIASLLGETTAETKIALTKLKESIIDE